MSSYKIRISNPVLGLPISYLDRHCPSQFEIIGIDEAEGVGLSNGLFCNNSPIKQCSLQGELSECINDYLCVR